MPQITAKTMTRDERVARVQKLIEQFSQDKKFFLSKDFVEAECRSKFIDPLLECLGWDVKNEKGARHDRQEVITEDRVMIDGATKHPDYTLCYGGERKFYVEAKQPSVNLKSDPDPALQVRRYAYTSKMPIAVLTDFQELAIYDTRIKPKATDGAEVARIDYYTLEEYAEKFDELYDKISWDAVDLGKYDSYYEGTKDKRGTASVDDDILAMIEDWRVTLAEDIALKNGDAIDEFNLTAAVQKIIDRILFLRIAEDKEIEERDTLKKIVTSYKVVGTRNSTTMPGTHKPQPSTSAIYSQLKKLFESANDKFNAGLFATDKFLDSLIVSDKSLKAIINALYYPECQYEFSVLPVEILGSIYERFLGKTIRFSRKTKSGHSVQVVEKPEVQKAGGVYYTPSYIVRYIVQQTLGQKLAEAATPEKAASLKVCDPACGSGSFLVGAYQYLLDWHLDYYDTDAHRAAAEKSGAIYKDARSHEYKLSVAEKRRILINSIYGVDIDAQAVEVTKLSLFLKLLENEGKALSSTGQGALFRASEAQKILPDLQANIKCGNSLVGSDYYADKDLTLFGIEEQRKVNVFDWDKNFKFLTAEHAPLPVHTPLPVHATLSKNDTLSEQTTQTKRGETQNHLWTRKFGSKQIFSYEQLENEIQYVIYNREKHQLPVLNSGACSTVSARSTASICSDASTYSDANACHTRNVCPTYKSSSDLNSIYCSVGDVDFSKEKIWHVTSATHNSRYSERMKEYNVKLGKPVVLSEKDELLVIQTVTDIIKADKLKVFAFNVCRDHIHIIISCTESALPKIMQKIKAVTARAVNIANGKTVFNSGACSTVSACSAVNIRPTATTASTCSTVMEGYSVKNYAGFDCVIGNPPYGAELSADERKYLSVKFSIGSTDTAALFMALADRLLVEGGCNGFIIPKPFLYASNWEKTRQVVSADLEKIVDCGKVWKNVKLEQIIFVRHKNIHINSYISFMRKDEEISLKAEVQKSDCEEFGFFLNDISNAELAIAKKMRKANLFLEKDFCSNSRGAMYQKVLKESQINSDDFMAIGGKQLARYSANEGIKGYVQKKDATDHKGLINKNSVLVQNLVAQIMNPVPHVKIIATVPEMFDSEKTVLLDTVNQLTINENHLPKFVLGVINTPLISWYVYLFIFGRAIRTMHFDSTVTSRIPFPKADAKAEQAIATLADQRIAAATQLAHLTAENAPLSNVQMLQQRCGILDSQINARVYELYGLTAEEIAVIEGSK